MEDKTLYIKMLEDAGEKLANRDAVLQLCARDVSDYDRGVVQGRIEMISHLMRELVGDKK